MVLTFKNSHTMYNFFFLEGTQFNMSDSYVPVVVHSQSLIPEQDNPLQ